jgi:GNAT superfamily N-acetyltransferase
VCVEHVEAAGLEYLALATTLLQRARLADPEAGVWEAADLQWWWRAPRSSDELRKRVWIDDEGPIASVALTDWSRTWGCDPIVVPGTAARLADVWAHAMETVDALQLADVEVLARDDDEQLLGLLEGSGFAATGDVSGIMWMDADERPEHVELPEGFDIVDRARPGAPPHPMRRRNGEAVEQRLRQTSLYDPQLDLAVETESGTTAGYALFWFDPVTRVGVLEPMRVEDAYQRRGLARALIATGLERLSARGALRFMVGFGTDAARRLYEGSGFRVTATTTAYALHRHV